MDHVFSRVLLMREYLRRAALVVGDVQPPGWPFADLAAVVAVTVRADESVTEDVVRTVRRAGQFSPIPQTCAAAVHWSRLAADRGLPWPDPFEPLLLMYERGGGFTFSDAGMIEVDLVGVPHRPPAGYLSAAPIASLDIAFLAETDAAFEQKLANTTATALHLSG
ncbi:hypothetical protein [Actinoplanes sp. NPDC020271]|uniref:hypothetical protein n=1 Tax=Actinoplanes sp. NPDC020271 TaxID=3363896 RepID=UPI0037990BEB